MPLAQAKTDGDELNSPCVPDEFTRIVVLGKTGVGKSSLANTLFGEIVFAQNSTPTSGTSQCQAQSTCVNGKHITFIDTPGFFDTRLSEEEMKPEIMRCITECAPGPHVFIIVLKVEKYTEQEKEIIQKLNEYFSEEALKFATVLFTYGDQLPEEQKIEEFVKKSKDLNELIDKCGGRCNVIDNKYWAKNPEEDYRSNKFQIKKLLSTIDEIIQANNGDYYSNEFLQAVQGKIDQESENIKESSSNLSQDEITEKAKSVVIGKRLHERIRSRELLKAFLSGAMRGAMRMEEPVLLMALIGEASRTVTTENVEMEALPTPAEAPCPEMSDEEMN